MTTDPGTSRRVSRLEHDVEAVYEILVELRSTLDEHGRRLELLGTTQDEHTHRFDRLESTLGEILRRLPDAS